MIAKADRLVLSSYEFTCRKILPFFPVPHDNFQVKIPYIRCHAEKVSIAMSFLFIFVNVTLTMVCLGSTATDSVSSWELGSHFLRGEKKRTGKFEELLAD
jgi:hypothetical protein